MPCAKKLKASYVTNQVNWMDFLRDDDVIYIFVFFEVGLHISSNAYLQNPYLFSYRFPARCITD